MTTSSLSTRPATGRRFSLPLLVLVVAIAIAAGSYGASRLGLGGHGGSTGRLPAAPVAGASHVPLAAPDGGFGLGLGASGPSTDTTSLTKAIGVWAGNLRRDPEDFVSAENLALVYYTRGRLTGSADDYAQAQAAVTQALAAYPTDPGGRTMQALLQYTLHDFEGARSAAQAIYDADPTQLQALATVGDSELELGQYEAAASTFATLGKVQPGSAVTARVARLASLKGDDAAAATLAAQAVTEAKAEGAEGTSLAFYPYLQGYLAFQNGRLDDALAADGAALTAWPGSYLALEGEAKALAAQGRLDAAIQRYQEAIAIVPQPEFLAGLGDLHALSGRPDLAAKEYATVRAIAGLQAKLYNRQLVLFDVNHGEDVAGALTLAENEVAIRQDVYGWDAYAWALLANGRAADADAAMRKALALGTNDPLLDYHAGMIANALGDRAGARRLLQAALDINPGFDPLQAVRARDVLKTLPAG